MHTLYKRTNWDRRDRCMERIFRLTQPISHATHRLRLYIISTIHIEIHFFLLYQLLPFVAYDKLFNLCDDTREKENEQKKN